LLQQNCNFLADVLEAVILSNTASNFDVSEAHSDGDASGIATEKPRYPIANNPW